MDSCRPRRQDREQPVYAMHLSHQTISVNLTDPPTGGPQRTQSNAEKKIQRLYFNKKTLRFLCGLSPPAGGVELRLGGCGA